MDASRSSPNAITAEFDCEEYEVSDYEKRLPKRFMSDKSGGSVYIGAPEEFADWIGYSVEGLFDDPSEMGRSDSMDATENDSSSGGSADSESGGMFSKLFG